MNTITRMSTRRRTVVALATAGVVAGLVAVAAPIASGSSGGGDNSGPVATGPAAGVDVAKRDRWAVVNADATLGRGRGVISVESPGTGAYIVHFNKNVRNCMYSGTIGLSGASGTESPGFITTVGAAVDVNGVFITTDDITGNGSPRGFHLYVGC